ncbi:MAG: hypothetical protein ABSE90_11660, partial [Verrucomicrobiota bacterium]
RAFPGLAHRNAPAQNRRTGAKLIGPCRCQPHLRQVFSRFFISLDNLDSQALPTQLIYFFA